MEIGTRAMEIELGAMEIGLGAMKIRVELSSLPKVGFAYRIIEFTQLKCMTSVPIIAT